MIRHVKFQARIGYWDDDTFDWSHPNSRVSGNDPRNSASRQPKDPKNLNEIKASAQIALINNQELESRQTGILTR